MPQRNLITGGAARSAGETGGLLLGNSQREATATARLALFFIAPPSPILAGVLTLAIETSGPTGSIALLRGETCLAERTLLLGVHHGQSLIPELQKLLAELGHAPRDCGWIAVSVGPGSFTGLRVGVVCAKTWAYAIGGKVVAVDTHQAIAENAPADVLRLQVVSEAQRGDVFFSRFERDAAGHWQETGPLSFLPVAEWIATLASEDVISGPGLAKLQASLAGRFRCLEPEMWRPRGEIVGRLGVAQGDCGEFADLATLEPRYLRRSSAEEKWDLRVRR